MSHGKSEVEASRVCDPAMITFIGAADRVPKGSWDVAGVCFLAPSSPFSSRLVSWGCFLLHLEQNDLFVDLIRQLAHLIFFVPFDYAFQK